jgi:ribosome-binding protein aMBF1 (putative translation factor)
MSRLSDAEVVVSIRNITGWTQSQLAQQLAVTRAQISFIENGKKNISKRLIEILVHKLNVRREWLEEGQGEPFDKNNPPPPPQMSRQSKVLVTAAALGPFAPGFSATLAVAVGANEIIDKLVDAYDVRNPTELAQKIFKTSQSTVASWVRRNKVPEKVIERAIEETDLTIEQILTDGEYVYIKKVDLVDIIKRMSTEADMKDLRPSELISLFEKLSIGSKS